MSDFYDNIPAVPHIHTTPRQFVIAVDHDISDACHCHIMRSAVTAYRLLFSFWEGGNKDKD